MDRRPNQRSVAGDRRWSTHLMTVLVTVLSLVLTTGCASRTVVEADAADAFAGVPEDFSLDVLVETGVNRTDDDVAHRRAGRFIVFPDGSLHYGSDLPAGSDQRPAEQRVLSRGDMARLWSMVREAGLGERASAEAPVNDRLLSVGADEILTIVTITANGDRWSALRRTTGPDGDPVTRPLLRRLAQLAWATDVPPPDRTIAPRRYDFGPDPYARYRFQR
ncbi:MAG: hypothetical protein KC983_06645 [Phycisphaerales bacterium]|nr:hypothetical protein [Phycisphaerales bacterium]